MYFDVDWTDGGYRLSFRLMMIVRPILSFSIIHMMVARFFILFYLIDYEI
jgi:hypothetical protein